MDKKICSAIENIGEFNQCDREEWFTFFYQLPIVSSPDGWVVEYTDRISTKE